jgi:hypothetical protein
MLGKMTEKLEKFGEEMRDTATAMKEFEELRSMARDKGRGSILKGLIGACLETFE